MIKNKSPQKNKKVTEVANMFKRYNSLLIKESLYMYSTPKYKANIVNVKTNVAQTSANLSVQKTK
tara:strand:- start:1148 stop:1342 length:195 start_codon:yes stop_codon:yes gene_type:complete